MADRRRKVIDTGIWKPVDEAIPGMGRVPFKSKEAMARAGFVHQIKTTAFNGDDSHRDTSVYAVTFWSVAMHMVEYGLVQGNFAKAFEPDGVYVGFTNEVDQVTFALLAQEPSLERDESL